MEQAWSPEFAARVRKWCDHVAALGAGVLIDAGLVGRANFDRAAGIVAEEVFFRSCVHDYPPAPETLKLAADRELGAGLGSAAR